MKADTAVAPVHCTEVRINEDWYKIYIVDATSFPIPRNKNNIY